MTLMDDSIDEMSWHEPEMCQKCVFFKLRNMKFHCSHQEVDMPLDGVIQCGGKFFSQVYRARKG